MPGMNQLQEYEQAVRMGEVRLLNEQLLFTAVFSPPRPDWVNDREAFLRRQSASLGGPAKVMLHYTELLLRAQALVDFFSCNVGPSEEWPLTVCGEAEEAEQQFERLVKQLRDAVGLLTESA